MPHEDFVDAAKRGWDQLKAAGSFLSGQYSQAAPVLGEELSAAGNAVTSLPSSLYHSMADTETPEEVARYGKGTMRSVGPTGRAVLRSMVTPVETALEDYKNGRVTYDQFLANLPPALGGSAAAVVGGRVASDIPGAFKNALTPAAPAAVEPAPGPVAAKVAPATETELTANAYMRRQGLDRVPAPQVEVVGASPDAVKMDHARGKTISSDAAVSDEEANQLAQQHLNHIDKLRAQGNDPVQHLADIKARLELKAGNQPSPTAVGASSVKDVTPEALAAVRARALSNYTYAPEEGELQTTHRVAISDAKGKPAGEVTAVAPKYAPNDWQIDRVEAIQKQGTGSAAYRRLFSAAQDQANTSGEPVTVSAGGVQTPEAQNLWESTLKKQGYEPQGGKVIFQPQATPAAKIAPTVFDEINGMKKPVASVSSEPTVMEKLHGAVNRAMLPPESIDLTTDWKHAIQDELAKKGVSGGSDANSPTFFSKAERVTNQKVPNSASGDQILSTLKNNGVKDSEIQWMGLDDYLSGKSKVSKSDLQQFIKNNQIQLEETTKGGSHAAQLADLGSQRNQVFAENNRIWANSLRREPLSTELFNEMAEKGNPESVISRMPTAVQAEARRFVETDQQIHGFDKQIADLGKQASRAKFESYTLPGDKQNYSEKLLRLPETESAERLALNGARQEYNQFVTRLRDRLGDPGANPFHENSAEMGRMTPEERNEFQRLDYRLTKLREGERPSTNQTFRSSHFDEPNVLAHIRFDDRTAVDGAKTLFLEEAQSDWHQQGKRYGYQTPNKYAAGRSFESFRQSLQDKYGTPAFWDKVTPEERLQYGQLVEAADRETSQGKNHTIPDAPFKTDWHELAMKRMLRHAAENGYDRLAWTTGDQQAARYDLSKHVSRLEYLPDKKMLRAFDTNGHFIFDKEVEPEKISDYVGKEPARKLLASEPKQTGGGNPIHSIEGDGLKVGGDWAKALYDRAIPNFLKSYTKKWGAKVGTTDIVTGTDTDRIFVGDEPSQADLKEAWRTSAGTLHTAVNNVISAMQEGKSFSKAMDSYGTEQLAEKLGGKMQYGKPRTEKVHSIEITPEMKKSVLQGQPISKTIPQNFDWTKAVKELVA
jgi:hypothetical protein